MQFSTGNLALSSSLLALVSSYNKLNRSFLLVRNVLCPLLLFLCIIYSPVSVRSQTLLLSFPSCPAVFLFETIQLDCCYRFWGCEVGKSSFEPTGVLSNHS